MRNVKYNTGTVTPINSQPCVVSSTETSHKISNYLCKDPPDQFFGPVPSSIKTTQAAFALGIQSFEIVAVILRRQPRDITVYISSELQTLPLIFSLPSTISNQPTAQELSQQLDNYIGDLRTEVDPTSFAGAISYFNRNDDLKRGKCKYICIDDTPLLQPTVHEANDNLPKHPQDPQLSQFFGNKQVLFIKGIQKPLRIDTNETNSGVSLYYGLQVNIHTYDESQQRYRLFHIGPIDTGTAQHSLETITNNLMDNLAELLSQLDLTNRKHFREAYYQGGVSIPTATNQVIYEATDNNDEELVQIYEYASRVYANSNMPTVSPGEIQSTTTQTEKILNRLQIDPQGQQVISQQELQQLIGNALNEPISAFVYNDPLDFRIANALGSTHSYMECIDPRLQSSNYAKDRMQLFLSQIKARDNAAGFINGHGVHVNASQGNAESTIGHEIFHALFERTTATRPSYWSFGMEEAATAFLEGHVFGNQNVLYTNLLPSITEMVNYSSAYRELVLGIFLWR